MKIKIKNAALAGATGYKVNEIITIEDEKGIPKNQEWRNRLKDSKIDGCIEVVKGVKK